MPRDVGPTLTDNIVSPPIARAISVRNSISSTSSAFNNVLPLRELSTRRARRHKERQAIAEAAATAAPVASVVTAVDEPTRGVASAIATVTTEVKEHPAAAASSDAF